MTGFMTMKFHERKGHYPFMQAEDKSQPATESGPDEVDEDDFVHDEDAADIGDAANLGPRQSVASL